MTDKNIEMLAKYGEIYLREQMSKKLHDATFSIMNYEIERVQKESIHKKFYEAKRYCSLLEECGLEVNEYQSQINNLEKKI